MPAALSHTIDVVTRSPSLAGQTSGDSSESEDDVEIVLDASGMSTSALSSFGSAAHSRNASEEVAGDGSILGMLSHGGPSLSQQQQLFSPDVRAALSPAPEQLSAQDEADDRPVLIPCATANAGIHLHRWGCVAFGGPCTHACLSQQLRI